MSWNEKSRKAMIDAMKNELETTFMMRIKLESIFNGSFKQLQKKLQRMGRTD